MEVPSFILVYLLSVAIIGLPVLLSELTIGRSGRSNPIDSFKKNWHQIVPGIFQEYLGG